MRIKQISPLYETRMTKCDNKNSNENVTQDKIHLFLDSEQVLTKLATEVRK